MATAQQMNITQLGNIDDLYDYLADENAFNAQALQDQLHLKAITRQQIEAQLEAQHFRQLTDTLYGDFN